jgi:predicted site-specific integrase-resolvase
MDQTKAKSTLMPPNRAAERLSVSPRTLQSWRSKGVGPRWVRVGGVIRYSEDALDEYIKRRTQEGEG